MPPLSKAVDLISSRGTSVALGEALTAPDAHRARKFNSSTSFRSRRDLVLFSYGLIVGQESATNVPANDILAPLFLAVCGDPVGTAGDLSVSLLVMIEETLGFAAPSHLSTRSHHSGCTGSRRARCKNESRPSTRGTSCQIRRPNRPRT
jgi:hypothetical protein